MKKGSFKWLLVVMMIVAFAFAAVGCGDKVTISITNAGEVVVNETLTLTAEVKKGDDVLTDATVTWTVANKEGSTCNATITDNNKLKATAPGTVIVTAKSEGATVTKEITVKDNAAQKAADKFKADHGTVLGKTTTSISAGDKAAVDAAISAYNALSADAKALLASQKTLLDSLSAKIAQLENEAALTAAVDGFRSDYADALGFNVEEITEENREVVLAALEALDALPADVQAELAGDKELLEALVAKMDLLVERDGFAGEFEDALALTVDTVALGDKAMVEEALAAYNALSDEAKELLKEEKANLDALKTKLAALQAEYDSVGVIIEFRTKYADILAKYDFENGNALTDDVVYADAKVVAEALAKYATLNASIKLTLYPEYVALTFINGELGAATFRTTHAAALALTEAGIKAFANWDAYADAMAKVKAAIKGYNDLTPTLKDYYAAENTLLGKLETALKGVEKKLYVAAFKSTYDLKVANVVAGNLDAIVKAVTAYNSAYDATILTSDEIANLKALYSKALDLKVTDFRKTHATILGYDEEIIIVASKTMVEKAYADYEALTKAYPEYAGNAAGFVKIADKLTTEKSDLTKFRTKIAKLEAVDFLDTHHDTFLITDAAATAAYGTTGAGTAWTKMLKQINDAIAAYDKLNAALLAGWIVDAEIHATYAVADVTTAKDNLDRLFGRIEYLDFCRIHAAALDKTLDGTKAVKSADRAIVQAAIDAYYKKTGTVPTMSEKGRTLLLPQIQLLAGAGSTITDVDATVGGAGLIGKINSLDADAFELAHKTILAIEAEDIVLTNKAAVTAVRAAYTALAAGVKNETLLTGVKALIEAQENVIKALEWQVNNKTLLAIKDTTVKSSDRAAIYKAWNEGKNISSDIDLSDDLDLLEELLGVIDEIDLENFTIAHREVLKFTADTITPTRLGIVRKAIAEFENYERELSRYALVEMFEDNGIIELIYELEGQIQAIEFRNTHRSALMLTTDTVAPPSRNIVLAAWKVLNAENPTLTSEAFRILADDVDLITELLETIESIEEDNLLAKHANVFDLNAVELKDKAAILAAQTEIVAYQMLVASYRGKTLGEAVLAGDLENLEALMNEIIALEFEVAHGAVYELSDDMVAIADESRIKAAQAAYEDADNDDIKDAIDTLMGPFDFDSLLNKITALKFAKTHAGAIGVEETEEAAYKNRNIIAAALDAYDKLEDAVQMYLFEELSILDMLMTFAAYREYEVYTNTYAKTLDLNTADYDKEDNTTGVRKSDASKVKAAISNLTNNISKMGQDMLSAEKDHLDSLQAKIDAITFTDTYSKILAMNTDPYDKANNPNGVRASDESSVNKAVDAYAKLSAKAEGFLQTGTGALLTDLAAEASELKVTELADGFKEKNETAIKVANGTTAMSMTNYKTIATAMTAYLKLSQAVRLKLQDEEIGTKLRAAEKAVVTFGFADLAEKFKTAHNKAIALVVDEQTTSTNNAIVTKAIDAYNLLDWRVRAQLAPEFSHLNALAAKIKLVIDTKTAGDFKFKYADILALNTSDAENFTATQRNLITAALKAVESFNDEVEVLLAIEIGILDGLKVAVTAVDDQIAADKFKDVTAKYVLDLVLGTPGSNETEVGIVHEKQIKNAMAAFEKLSDGAKVILGYDPVQLDPFHTGVAKALKDRLNKVTLLLNEKAVADFLATGKVGNNTTNTYENLLTGTTTLLYSHRTAVNNMRTKYNTLVKDNAAVKALLDAFANSEVASVSTMDDAIKALETDMVELGYENEATTFRRNNKTVLEVLETDTVRISNKASVTKAMNAWKALAEEVQDLLGSEYSHIEDLLDAIAMLEMERDASLFATTYKTILELEIEDVDEALHRNTLNNAIAAYNKLSEDTQDYLSYEFSIIESLIEALNEVLANNFRDTYETALDHDYFSLSELYADAETNWTATKALNAEAAVEYAKLSEAVQEMLALEENYFELLAIWEVIVEFEAEFREILEQNESDLMGIFDEAFGEEGDPSDWTAIKEMLNAAYAQYITFDAFVRAEMVDVISIDATFFEEMITSVNYIEAEMAVSLFLEKHDEILSKLPEDVTIDEILEEEEFVSDEPAIDEALADYNAFESEAVKGLLAHQKETLDALKAQINLLKAARKAADDFNTKYSAYAIDMDDAEALEALFNDRRATIFAEIEEAIATLQAMNDETLYRVELLGWDEALFESLLLLVGQLESEAFQADYAALISADLSLLSDEEILALEELVDEALARFEEISEDAQGLLTAEKDKIDAVKEAIEEIKAPEVDEAA